MLLSDNIHILIARSREGSGHGLTNESVRLLGLLYMLRDFTVSAAYNTNSSTRQEFCRIKASIPLNVHALCLA